MTKDSRYIAGALDGYEEGIERSVMALENFLALLKALAPETDSSVFHPLLGMLQGLKDNPPRCAQDERVTQ